MSKDDATRIQRSIEKALEAGTKYALIDFLAYAASLGYFLCHEEYSYRTSENEWTPDDPGLVDRYMTEKYADA